MISKRRDKLYHLVLTTLAVLKNVLHEAAQKEIKSTEALTATEMLHRDEYRFHEALMAGNETICPCCGRKAALRKRKLNAGMARVLIRIYHITPRSEDDGWVHIHDIFNSTSQKHRDWTQLKHWGLVVPRTKRTKEENALGYWRITELGIAFVEKRARVPSHAFIFNDFCLTRSDEQIDIEEALSSKFNYQEIMGT